jgi:hypothetical protein
VYTLLQKYTLKIVSSCEFSNPARSEGMNA